MADKLLAGVVGQFPPTASLLGGILGRPPVRNVNLPQDESYQENVEFIYKQLGRDVRITSDMPPIHEECGLSVETGSTVFKIDGDMKAGMVSAIKKVKAKQAASGGYISWKSLLKIFDSESEGLFHPNVDKDRTRYNNRVTESGFKVDFEGGMSQSDLAAAEKVMRDCVQDGTIWDALKIDINVIKQIFGRDGIMVGGPLEAFFREENTAHIAIDVGVVRFPLLKDPFFRLYRFRVIVFRSATSFAFFDKKTSGIFCEFRERVYNMDERFTAKYDKAHDAAVDKRLSELLAVIY